jgi:Rrf2 family protein
MIKISRQVDYALQLLFALSQAKNGETVSLKVFSTESNISFLFLQKIAAQLRKNGLIVASRGPHGGYRLAKPMTQITLKTLIEVVDGGYGVSACTRDSGACHKMGSCHMQKGMQKLHNALTTQLEQLTAADMIA